MIVPRHGVVVRLMVVYMVHVYRVQKPLALDDIRKKYLYIQRNQFTL